MISLENYFILTLYEYQPRFNVVIGLYQALLSPFKWNIKDPNILLFDQQFQMTVLTFSGKPILSTRGRIPEQYLDKVTLDLSERGFFVEFFYPTALKGSRVLFWPMVSGWVGGWSGGRKKFVRAVSQKP